MENLKFIIFSVLVLGVVGLIGFWAVKTIQPGDIYANKQKLRVLEEQNKELAEQVEKLKNENVALQSSLEEAKQPAPAPAPLPVPTPAPTPTPAASSSKYQSLINDLQKLVNSKIVLKEKSQGTAVGTLQKFLNIYRKTNRPIDNDFGKTTKADVIVFQKDQGLKQDGIAGTSVLTKMVSWLKKQK